jgi:hypothetical protein
MFLDPSISVQAQIGAGLKEITDAVMRWAIPLAAIGSVSMAVIQAAKNVTPVRNWFQRYRLRKWIGMSVRKRIRGQKPIESSNGHGDEGQQEIERLRRAELESICLVERDLVLLAASGDQKAFYDLPIDELCDQIRKVLSVVIDYPKFHKALLYCLARGASPKDIHRILNEYESDLPIVGAKTDDADKEAFREYAAAKSRVLIQIRCSVDAIQSSIGFRWKLWLQSASMFLSAVLGVVALDLGVLTATKGSLSDPSMIWTSIVIGFLAGFLAPIARDLLAALEKLRS